MNDITLLYCTASTIQEDAAEKVRQNLLQITESKYPIVSVSQKPLKFGDNICVGEIGKTCYNFFKQMLLGARAVKTKYIVHIDDDTLYVPEHFTHRPPDEQTFIYNTHSWIAGSRNFWRPKVALSGMFCHISPTKALIDNLSVRFKLRPTQPRDDRHFGEPGKFDTEFGIPNAKVKTFRTTLPLVSFEYRGSLNGKRKRYGNTDPDYNVVNLEPFGNAKRLRREYWNE